MMTPVAAYVALGSNVGDRRGIIRSAVRAIGEVPEVEVRALSAVRETPPVGPAGQGPYLNAVVAVDTTLAPRALLEACLAIERAHGRRRSGERWGLRTRDSWSTRRGPAAKEPPGGNDPGI